MKTATFRVGLGLLLALLGLAALRAAVVKSAGAHPSDYRDADFLLSRAGVSGWAVSPRRGARAFYPSLYSPRLREWVGHEPEGTAIGLDTSPADVPLPRNSPRERELRDFGGFCKAHGVHFFPIPVS